MKILIVTEKMVLDYNGRFYTDGSSPAEFAMLAADNVLHLLTPTYAAGETPKNIMEIDKNITVHSLGSLKYFHALPPFYAILKTAIFSYKLCKKEAFDIVVAKGPREIGMAGVFGAKLAKVPVIYHHSLDWFSFPPIKMNRFMAVIYAFYRRLIKGYRLFFTYRIIKMADVVATVSDDFRNDFKKRFGVDAILMPNTFTLRRELLNIPSLENTVKNRVIYIGRIDANKNVGLLIRSIKILIDHGIKDLTLTIIGDGPELGNCKLLAGELVIAEKVNFLGYVPNDHLDKYLHKSLLLVLPSFSEAFGNAVLEAMAAARPVVASRVGGLKDLVVDNESGFLFDPADVNELADKLQVILQDTNLARKMGEYGRQIAREYTPEKTLKKWISSMEGVVNKKRSKKIMYVFGSFGGGGTEHHFLELLKRLNQKLFKSSVYIISKDDNFDKHICYSGTRVYGINKKKVPRIPGLHLMISLVDLIVKVNREKPDVIHTYFFWGHVGGVIAGKISGIKTIVSNREDTGFGMKSRINFNMLKHTNRHTKKIIAIADFIRDARRETESIPQDKIMVIRNGISFDAVESAFSDKNVRDEFGMPKNAFIVCTIANMHHPVKGYPYLLECAKRLVTETKDIYFLLVGDGTLKAEYEVMSKQMGLKERIIFAGYRNDIRRLLSEIDIFVLFSLSEGLPISILEAMREAKPVLASNVGGVPEIIIDNKTGLLVEAKDVDSLVKKIKMLYHDENLRQELGRAGYIRAKEEFNIDDVVKKYEEVYT